MSETGLVQILEGALLAAGKPLSVAQLGNLFEEKERPENTEIREALKEIEERCEGRGFELQQVASGFRFQVRQELSTWIGRLWTERAPRYSRALLETLSLIAYRQPITRGEIEEIRGVAVSSNIIKTLHEREWIRVVGHRDVPGRPAMYATTKQFLDYFSLKSLDQLPALAEIRDLETLNAELGFTDPVPQPGGQGEGPDLVVVGGTEHTPDDETGAEDVSGEQEGEEVAGEELHTEEGFEATGDVPVANADESAAIAELADELESRAPQAFAPGDDGEQAALGQEAGEADADESAEDDLAETPRVQSHNPESPA